MTSQKKLPDVGAMSMVTYEHASLEDAELRVLGPATINVTTPTRLGHTSHGGPAGPNPDAIVEVETPDAFRARLDLNSVSAEGDGFIYLAFWLQDALIVVRCTRLMMDGIVDSWVERILSYGKQHVVTVEVTNEQTVPVDAVG